MRTDEPALGRWALYVAGQEARERLVRGVLRDFPRVPEAEALELYDELCLQAVAEPGEPNAFPGGEDEHALLRGWLRERLRRRLLNYVERRAARHTEPEALDVLADPSVDPSAIAERRETLAIVGRVLREELADDQLAERVRTYLVAERLDGRKRADIRAEFSWSADQIRTLRERVDRVMTTARAAALALVPIPLFRLLTRLQTPGPAADAVAGGTKAAAVVAVTGALAAGGAGAVAVAGDQEVAAHRATQAPSPALVSREPRGLELRRVDLERPRVPTATPRKQASRRPPLAVPVDPLTPPVVSRTSPSPEPATAAAQQGPPVRPEPEFGFEQ